MKESTTDFAARLRSEFEANPIKTRVCLPDGSPATVVAFHETDQGRVYKVRGIHRDGRFRSLGLLSCWFAENELRLFYYTADIHPDWSPDRPGLN
jgi:hypothetical protein